MQTDRKLVLSGIAAGAIYGLALRALAFVGTDSHPVLGGLANHAAEVMSIAFLTLLPFSMGFITIAFQARRIRVGILKQIFEPWIAVLAAIAACALALWEGAICIVMLMPIALVCSSLGGLAAGFVVSRHHPRTAMLSIVLVGVLPIAIAPVEKNLVAQADIRSVESSIEIHSDTTTIWNNIERVPAIAPQELPPSWNRTIGFPRPIEATLDHEGIGGVRHATFAGGVLFIETIDVWDPLRRLGFSIHADSKSIPPTTLDEHVTIGGPYFDVLHGEYILEPVSPDVVRLRLVSRHRVSTDFNWYARLWTDAVMRSVQESILYVIKNRCEGRS
jgi:hypothetical protein